MQSGQTEEKKPLNALVAIEEKILKLSPAAYIRKPFDNIEFLTKIRDILR